MKKKRLSQEERRTQIIAVAMNLFARKGFKGTTTRAIAKAACVSEAIIFRHFATKEDLYEAIINHTVEQRQAIWEKDAPILTSTENLETILHNFASAYIRRNREDPTFIRLMVYSALEEHKFREKFFEIYRSPHIQAIRNAIQTGIDNGLYRPVNPYLTSVSFFWSLVYYCISRLIGRSQVVTPANDDEMIDNLVSIYVNGLRIRPENL